MIEAWRKYVMDTDPNIAGDLFGAGDGDAMSNKHKPQGDDRQNEN